MPVPTIYLRNGLRTDIPAMYRLDLLCFDPPFRFDLRAMRRYATAPGAIVLVAEQETLLCGFVIVNVMRDGVAYVTTLDVHPDVRRHGVGRTLVAAAEAAAIEANRPELYLHVSHENESAIRFYESIGFERRSLARNFYGHDRHAWIYTKSDAKMSADHSELR